MAQQITMWQKCPICNGEGRIPNVGTSSSMYSICPTCNGQRIISEINGLPSTIGLTFTNSSSSKTISVAELTNEKESVIAEDLFITYRYVLSIPNAPLGENKDNVAKQCALIAVKFAKENPLNTEGYKKYLNKVEQEIEKL